MTFQPDMQFGDDESATVGYLHPDHPFETRAAEPEFLVKLKEFVSLAGMSVRELGIGVCAGIHVCEFCGKACGSLNFGVPAGERIIFAPELIGHYVEVHQYAPPVEFIGAVMASPLPGTREYVAAIAPWIARRRAAAKRDDVSITLERHVALVLFEFLNRFGEEEAFSELDRADRVAIWTIVAELESVLVEPFAPEYEEFLR
jgi:hypothetical protein